MTINPIPEGYYSLTPYLIIKDAAKAIEFYKAAFDTREKFRMERPDGSVGHTELLIGGSMIMLTDEALERGCKGPSAYGGCPISLHLYVDNADQVVDKAIAAGATLNRPVENQFYGDRSGAVIAPFGYVCHIASRIENLSDEEIKQRGAKST